MQFAQQGHFSATNAAMGSVSGLVAVTPACGFVSPMSSIAIAFLGSFAAYYGLRLKAMLGVDDTLDVSACHGVAGFVGMLLTGCFADVAVNPNGANGLFYGNAQLLGVQTLAVVVVAVAASVLTWLILMLLKYTPGVGLRPTPEEEAAGLDVLDHGSNAYMMVIASAFELQRRLRDVEARPLVSPPAHDVSPAPPLPRPESALSSVKPEPAANVGSDERKLSSTSASSDASFSLPSPSTQRLRTSPPPSLPNLQRLLDSLNRVASAQPASPLARAHDAALRVTVRTDSGTRLVDDKSLVQRRAVGHADIALAHRQHAAVPAVVVVRDSTEAEYDPGSAGSNQAINMRFNPRFLAQ